MGYSCQTQQVTLHLCTSDNRRIEELCGRTKLCRNDNIDFSTKMSD